MNSIVLFNNDLRLKDNKALQYAVSQGKVLPVFILNEDIYYKGAMGNLWLYKSLQELNKQLDNKLMLFKGDTKRILFDLLDKLDIDNIYWNRLYEPKAMQYFSNLKTNLQEKNYNVKSFNSYLITEPASILKKDQTAYKVFTPYSKQVLANLYLKEIEKVKNIEYLKHDVKSLNLDDLNLLNKNKTWHLEFLNKIKVSEKDIEKSIDYFVENNLDDYLENRNIPDLHATSMMSAYLHFGQISVYEIIAKVEKARTKLNSKSVDCYINELIWRDFSYYLLYHFNNLDTENFNAKFDGYIWNNNPQLLEKWQKGKTGIPIIDAGLRQLYQTGYMHNRVRMIVASFLVKNLRINWKEGAKWFEYTLFDADLASNSASWQWVAGTGADAAPYFRIFNPVLQSKKFDKDASYIKKFVPELKDIPSKYIHEPHLMPEKIALMHNFNLEKDYCYPLVDLAESRSIALQIYKDNVK